MAKEHPPVDTTVRLPAAVLAAAQRAENLVKAQSTPESNSTPAPAPTAPPPSTAPAPAAPPPPAPAAPAPAAPAPAAPAPAAPPPPPQSTEPDWKARYDAMKGRFDQTNNALRAQASQIEQLQNLIAMMQTAPPAAPAAADVRFVSPQEAEEYGSEFLDVVGKRTKEVVTPEIESLRAEVKRLEAQLGRVHSTASQTVREKMYDELTRNIPNWREINEDQNFLAWLALPDPYSGDIRHKLLRNAFEANLTGRVLAFFQGYLAQEAATRPAEASTTREAAGKAPQIDLASLAAPGRAKQSGANNPAPVEKPIFTSAQIRQFYKEVSNGYWKGRDQERLAMEKEIFAAGNEGRIRN